jgi:hypothetical protein
MVPGWGRLRFKRRGGEAPAWCVGGGSWRPSVHPSIHLHRRARPCADHCGCARACDACQTDQQRTQEFSRMAAEPVQVQPDRSFNSCRHATPAHALGNESKPTDPDAGPARIDDSSCMEMLLAARCSDPGRTDGYMTGKKLPCPSLRDGPT